ncbi:tyrosinase family protein [Methyloversatilis sp.]|uniref:tyrosinase family protein n=1 Tax=Methyloversatilis sp. TaxID=2569862 RepID=UPI002734CE81|nr:tyrosinase family protein [Methyloversatilis sp.]MDP2868358.1 tyrosinase family protein [Methyloversatilis sp.]MDP3454191.1 tyrosinase family protein [Methyloversatilis sp.]MDP3578357.1 tyrosinase family protein [Methyloversatilis sp.]
MNRRKFINFAHALGLSGWFGEMAFAQATTIRTRKSATTSAAVVDIDTLRKGVEMLASDSASTEYKSWMYWANSHGTPGTVPPAMAKVWSQCHHGTLHFLTWHRAYVFFFESVIREITQQNDFALPYWDWYGSNGIPKSFGEPTNSGKKNPLFHSQRAFRSRTLIRDSLQQPTFEAFQSSLEGNPHGTVHVMVGGEMGSVGTSARDPVFWAHHTNIDRMWDVWLAFDSSRKNPTDVNWLKQRFAFDVDGNKALVVSDMLSSNMLGYRYDSVAVTGPTDPIPPRPIISQIVQAETGNVSGMTPQALATKKKVLLSGESLNIQFLIPAKSKDKISTMATAPAGKSAQLSVVLEGVRVTDLGLKHGFEYRVYANLPKQTGSQHQHRDFYLGVINSFQLGHHAKHGTSIIYQISPLAARQAKNSTWSISEVSLSLVSDDNEEKRPLVEIDNVRLMISPEPLM